jgi:S-DNA-T family DNA segregation ATPase FtsK/SpoIIIE
LRNSFFVIPFLIILFLAYATIVQYPSLVGKWGSAFAQFNIKSFGYMAYINMLLLLYPLYRIAKDPNITQRRIEIFFSSALLFLATVILETLILHSGGVVGRSVVGFLYPFLGLVGIWVFWLMITTLSVFILTNMDFSALKHFEKKERLEDEVFEEVDDKPWEEEFVSTYEKPKEKVTQNESVKEVADPLDEPAYLRQEKTETANNVSFEDEVKRHEDQLKKGKSIDLQKSKEDEESLAVQSFLEKKEKGKHPKIVEELEENKVLLDQLERGKREKIKNFALPSVNFLAAPQGSKKSVSEDEIDEKIQNLIEKLRQFKIEGDVIRTYTGPIVTTFEFKPAANVKVSKILNLQDDLAMALSAQTIRIQAPVPGKDVVGIEIPNNSYETIYLRELIDGSLFKEAKSPLTIALGKDIVGKPFLTDLKKLPHLLIAGTTGSGKSVGINGMILSLLYRNSPDQLKLLMIDPKMLEFSIYNDIPHLLTPVITKAKQAVVALNNMVYEMERRYALLSESRTKNIEGYNEKMKKMGGEPLPFIVVVIDELADLMMTSGKDVEYSIACLAQMARASGIHLIVATQRPSVDVVTGLIKANLPSRISYKVGQRIDSKVILDALGAESLLGRGDMLFTPPGMSGLVRLHAPWSSEEEIETIVEYLKDQRAVEYDAKFLQEESELSAGSAKSDLTDDLDELFDEAKSIVLSDRKSSISYLQRKLQIGYNRSARIIEQLEATGVLSAPNAKGNREILQ